MKQLTNVVFSPAADASKDATGGAIPTASMFQCSVQAVSTGASTGTLKLQFSNDLPNPTVNNWTPTNWSDIPSATVSISAASVAIIGVTSLCFNWIRAVYTKNNGSAGSIAVNIQLMGN